MDKRELAVFGFAEYTYGLLLSCGQEAERGWIITLTNPARTDLTQKAITVNRADFSTQPDFYPLLLNAQGDTIPSQVDDVTGDGTWDELFFLVDIPAVSEVVLHVKSSKGRIDYSPQTAVRFGKRDSATDPVTPR